LKIVENYKKEWKKEKAPSKLNYLWGWFDGAWQDAEYVSVLASLPSKEELVWKFLYMVKYPLQGFVTVNSNLISWFVRVLDQIKDKK
jgi:ribosomal protein L10